MSDNPNTGHGHVFPRPDGVRARCGGPSICSECAKDLARKHPPVPTPDERARKAAIMERIRYCLDHDNPEGTTLVSWMADEILAALTHAAQATEKAELTDSDLKLFNFVSEALQNSGYQTLQGEFARALDRLTRSPS